jgi:hypothetical protein
MIIADPKMHIAPAAEIESFYRSAALGLRFLEAREGRGRRFGEAALAGWRALGGEFEDRDRLDLLVRDAAANNPTAFAPRVVFGMTWLGDDEPFGPEWPQATTSLASSLLREAPGAVGPLPLTRTVAEKWSLALPNAEPALADLLGSVAPATRLVVGGPLAVSLLEAHASGRTGLDLGDQVLFVADSPAERQMIGFALLVSGAKSRPKIVAPTEDALAKAKAMGCTRIDLALVSNDASATVRGAALDLKKELGG